MCKNPESIKYIEGENSVFEKILEALDNGIIVVDAYTLEMIYSNSLAKKYALMENTNDTGYKCYHYMFGLDNPCVKCCLQKALESGDAENNIFQERTGRTFSCKMKKMDWYGREAVSVYITDVTQKMKNTRELQHSERLLKQAVEDSGQLEWRYDFKKETLTNENKVLRLSGYLKNPNCLPETQIQDGYIALESQALCRKMYQQMREGASSVCEELWFYKNKNKNDKHCLRISYTVDFDSDGNPIFASGLGLDITNEKNLEILYQKQIENLMKTYPNALGMVQMNLTQNVVTGQSGFRSLIPKLERNLSISAYLKFLQENLPTDDNGGYEKYISRRRLLKAYESGQPQFSYTHKFQLKNTAMWIQTTVRILQNPTTNNLEAYIFVIDITEKTISDRIMERVVRMRYDVLALIYPEQGYVDYHYWAGEYGGVPEVTDKDYDQNCLVTAKLYGKEQEEIYIHNTSRENVLNELKKNEEYSFTLTRMIDGKKYYKCFSYNYLSKGKDIILATVQDVTPLYEKEEAHLQQIQDALDTAKRANTAKTAFLSNMSHDIRTPMNAIINMARMAEEDIHSPERVLEELKKISTSSNFLLCLINDVLDMAKIDSGKMELHPQLYEYSEFINYVDSVFTPLCKNKDIEFIWDPGSTSYTIYVDILKFNQIFFNLLSNAVKYTNGGGYVKYIVKNNTVANGILSCDFVIQDNGMGMTKEFQQKMFEPFTREEREMTQTGTGLGLALVKSTVDLMGGTISVQSEVGKGTTFELHLDMPIATKEQLTTRKYERKNTDSNCLKGKHILVAEDHPINREIIKRLLERGGMQVDMAENGQECISDFLQRDESYFDAILMDVRMPILDGLMATKRIRMLEKSENKKIPIIAMTANAFAEDRIVGSKAGMTGYLVKPINPEELYSILREQILE